MSRPWKIGLALLAVIVLTIAYLGAQLVLPGPRIEVSKQTTYVTAPIAPDGLPDYGQYLRDKLKEGVTPDNNAAIPLLRATWPPYDVESEDYATLCAELGMEIPQPEESLPLGWAPQLAEDLTQWLLARAPEGEEISEEDPRYWGSEYTDWAESEPWTADELPLLAEWIEKQMPTYDLLHEAARREKCYYPAYILPGGTHLDLDCLVQATLGDEVMTSISLLNRRANLRLGSGDAGGAWHDCWAMYRIMQHLPRDITGNDLNSLVFERRLHPLAKSILSSPHLDVATARKMFEFFRKRGLRDGVIAQLDEGQRLVVLCYAISLSGQGGAERRIKDEKEGELNSPWHRTLDWNEILRVINAEYDRAVAEHRQRKRESNVAGLFDPAGLEGRPPGARFHPNRKERTNYFVANHLLTGLETVGLMLEMEERSNAQRQLLTTAAALAVYRLEQGEYPESLDSLVADLLDAVPHDIYDGKPLAYRRTEQGYLLYSRGPNGIDDGGANRASEIIEGYDAELWDFAATRENLNAVRELLGWPLLTEEEFAERQAAEVDPEEVPVIVLGEPMANDDADDLSIRLPLPRLKLPLPGE